MGILGLEHSINYKGVVMFFVIDFETSDLMPWIGSPLTLGIVPVNEAGEILDQDLYVQFPTWHLMPDWDMSANLSDTESWWNQKRLSDEPIEIRAWEAAWLRDSEDEDSSGQAIAKITDFLQVIEPDKNKRFLCANPIAFDKMWMDYIYTTMTDSPVPYHYRNLCLRSMQYGLDYGTNPEFGNARDHESGLPHHALYDARAEAIDLAGHMNRGRIVQEYLSDTRYLLDLRWHTNIESDS